MASFFQNRINLFEDRGIGKGEAYSPVNPIPSNALLADASVSNAGKVLETTTVVESETIEIQSPLKGFGSYLQDILPSDIAQGAGAFASSMLQIKNIKNVPIEKFAQVVTNIETTSGLTINGTNVPTDTTLAGQGLPLIAKGSGPFGTYTMSDFYGCMSGLPYIGLDIDGLIKKLETPTLYAIYENLYLAVKWEQPGTLTATYSDGGVGSYTLPNVTLPANRGGGYGREGTSAPLVTVAGGTATLSIGTDPTDLSTFGKITAVSWSAVGTTGSPTTSISIPEPTTIYGSSGWSPGMNDAIQYYIDAANAEILNIGLTKNSTAALMNTNWSFSGRKLSIEQEAISIGSQVSVPADATKDEPITNLAQYPITQISFTDLIPVYGLQTQPHMQAQTLEAISNLSTIGGQSIVGLMREARNQNRLTELGISLDNTINDTLTPTQNKQLIANGTLDGTGPAVLGQVLASFDAEGNVTSTVDVYPTPYGTYDTDNQNYYVTNTTYAGTQLGTVVDTGASVVVTSGPGNNVSGTGLGTGSGIGSGTGSGINPTVGISLSASTPIIGFPGSFAGSQYGNLIPANLNAFYTSNTLLPSTYTINEAIDNVIRCNCDCWDLA